jgi:hypothetical protein
MDGQDGRTRTLRLRRSSSIAIAAGAVAALGVASAPATAAPTITPTNDPQVIARAILDDPSRLTGAEFTSRPTDDTAAPAPTAATFTPEPATLFSGFPLSGADAGLLTSGDATLVPGDQFTQPDAEWMDDPGLETLRGAAVHDATTLRIDVDVPSTGNCLALSYRFLSEEFPEFVGSRFNDAFIAELDNSTWTTDLESNLLVPNDFATKAGGKPVSVNGVGPTSVTDTEAAGTVFDAATGLVTTKIAVTPGAHKVFLSIFDQSDRIYDSAVMLDRLAFLNESPATCKPPEVPVIVPPPPPPPAPGPPAPPPPPNDFTVPGGSVTFGNGSATITVNVPGPGVVTAADASAAGASRLATAAAKKKKLVKPARAVAKKAGPVRLKIKPTKAGKQILRKKKKLKVRLAITFTPTGGSPHTEVSKLTLKVKKRGKKH